jgi:dienelactone hydrolase
LLAASSCVLSGLLPMFRLPAPTGPYLLGTRIEQIRTEGPNARDVEVQLWYPAAPSRQPFASYRRREETTRQSSYQSVLPTNSRLDAPVASGSFPLLLFSPAWGGRRTQNTYLAEDLASHGFVVAAIDHPGNSGPTFYEDGHIDQPATGDAMDFATLSLDEINAHGASELERQTADEIGVLDALARENQDPESPLHRRLDLSRVGALGHSFGGAVAADAAIQDQRIKAALDLDGSFFGRMQTEGLPKPFMFIEQDLPVYADPSKRSKFDQINDAMNASDLEAMKKFGAYRIFLHGSTHDSFTDRSLFSPLARLSGVGAIPREREYDIVRAYALAFFDKTLRGADPALLKEVPGPYPEATLELIPGVVTRQG